MGTVFGKNTTSASITVAGHKVYYIDSADAEIVEVEDGNNVKYNAFKYTLSGTPYWYVIDGTHDTWTDDLSVWGYSEVPVGPVLPEVSAAGYFLYGTSDVRSITIASGETHDLYEYGGGKKSFDTSKSYATDRWQQGSAYTRNNVTSLQIVNNSGYFAVKNALSSSITNFICVVIAVCSDSTATVVTVYNSSNVAYNAFKYTANNTDYYYVLDGTQTDWTDDLSSIGYSLTPVVVLPTVSVTGDWGSWNWLATSINGVESISANSNTTNLGYNASTIFPNYDDTKTYGIVQWQVTGGETAGRVEFSIANASGKFQAHNNTNGTLSFYQAMVAVCSDSTATVVNVYNSSNVAYNAFKFTANGTDYYYVLDGTQTDWTDDLEGIGYHFTISYLTVNKSRMTVGIGESYSLYNASGTHLEYDSAKIYTAVKYYTGSADLVGTSALGITIGYISGWSYLMLTNNTGSAIQIQRIEYTVS